ncbi:hypothetical protein FE697_011555 [Mumia zhuanghuii]|uniref:DUF4352 domain-containing protein n=2 Tax=Mumia TaxID=1546255 RepID=A0ABW1QFD1_9ACTN|nr:MULTISPECIES: hypothetical protein [Mumia]KAA1422789.1 hypothetical protein FE697_011555 [Mumia zhuanghuii]
MSTQNEMGRRRLAGVVGAAVGVIVIALVVVFLVTRPSDGDGDTGADSEASAQQLPDNPSSDFTPGSLETVPVEEVEPASPVGLDEKAALGPDISATLEALRPVKGTARGAGEIAGPALQVKIAVTNGSDEKIDLGRAVVEVTYGKKRTPGMELSGPGAAPFPAALAAGDTAEGTYVFGVPKDARGRVQVTIAYTAGQPPAVFEGDASQEGR